MGQIPQLWDFQPRARREAKNVWLTVVDTLHPHHSTFKALEWLEMDWGKYPQMALLEISELSYYHNSHNYHHVIILITIILLVNYHSH